MKKIKCYFIVVSIFCSFILSGIYPVFAIDMNEVIEINSLSQITASGNYRLMNDEHLNSTFVIQSDWDVKLDLNGQAITVLKNGERSLYAIDVYGTFTLQDQSENKDGRIISRGIENYGTMSMLGGIIITCDSNGGGAGVWNEGNFLMNGGTLKVTGAAAGLSVAVPIYNTGTATITGGQLESDYISALSTSGYMNLSNISMSGNKPYFNTIKVTGGTADISNVTVNTQFGGAIEASGNSVVNVNQCMFTQTQFYDHNSMNIAASNGAVVNVNGGTYTSENFGLYVFNSGGTIHVNDGTFIAKNVIKADSSVTSNESEIVIDNGSFSGAILMNGKLSIRYGRFRNSGLSLDKLKTYLIDPLRVITEDDVYIAYPVITELQITKHPSLLKVGEQANHEIFMNPLESHDTVTWKSSKSDVASVDGNGLVTARKAGQTTITVSSDQCIASYVLTVLNVPEEVEVPSLPSSPSDNVEVGIVDEESQKILKDTVEKVIEAILNQTDTSGVSLETADKVLRAIQQHQQISIKASADPISNPDRETTNMVKDMLTKIASNNHSKMGVEVYLDLNILLMADQSDVLGNVTKLSSPIQFTVQIPEQMKTQNRKYHIARIHEGIIEILPTNQINDKEVTFMTDRFSVFAIIYEDVIELQPDQPLTNDPSVNTGDTTSTGNLLMLNAGSLGTLVCWFLIRKHAH